MLLDHVKPLGAFDGNARYKSNTPSCLYTRRFSRQ